MKIKRLFRDYWCLQTAISMYVTSQHDDAIMMIIAIYCDLLHKFGFLEIGLVDHTGVLQTPIIHAELNVIVNGSGFFTQWFISARNLEMESPQTQK